MPWFNDAEGEVHYGDDPFHDDLGRFDDDTQPEPRKQPRRRKPRPRPLTTEELNAIYDARMLRLDWLRG